jgi:hypothetical protein
MSRWVEGAVQDQLGIYMFLPEVLARVDVWMNGDCRSIAAALAAGVMTTTLPACPLSCPDLPTQAPGLPGLQLVPPGQSQGEGAKPEYLVVADSDVSGPRAAGPRQQAQPHVGFT